MFACDVFDDQRENTDRSGQNDVLMSVKLKMWRTTENKRAIFEDHLRDFGVEPSRVWTYSGSSLTMTRKMLRRAGLLPLRFLSVDGGHSAETVMSDLALAVAAIARGGIVALDDFTSSDWMGVREGLYRFLCPEAHEWTRRNATRWCGGRRLTLAPFLQVCNKLYLTTPSHHQRMLDAAMRDAWVGTLQARMLPDAHGWGSTRIAGGTS